MRTSGILMPITSLPSPWGVGTLGGEARGFVDFLARAGVSICVAGTGVFKAPDAAEAIRALKEAAQAACAAQP